MECGKRLVILKFRVAYSIIYLIQISKIKTWNYIPYDKDSFVEHNGKYYIAVADKNYVEPTDFKAAWLYVKVS